MVMAPKRKRQQQQDNARVPGMPRAVSLRPVKAQPAPVKVKAVAPPPDVSHEAYWRGRCTCGSETCKGRCPHVYMVAEQRRRKSAVDGRIVDVPRVVGRYVELGSINYECMLDRQAPKEGKRHKPTTESSSAVGLEWLAVQHAAGVAPELGECELAGESDDDLLNEQARFESFKRWNMTAPADDDNHRAIRQRRYLELNREHPGHRLFAWLNREFAGWIVPYAEVR